MIYNLCMFQEMLHCHHAHKILPILFLFSNNDNFFLIRKKLIIKWLTFLGSLEEIFVNHEFLCISRKRGLPKLLGPLCWSFCSAISSVNTTRRFCYILIFASTLSSRFMPLTWKLLWKEEKKTASIRSLPLGCDYVVRFTFTDNVKSVLVNAKLIWDFAIKVNIYKQCRK